MTQEKALVRGHLAKVWHVMMVTSAHGVIHVVVANVPPHPSRVIHFANTVMGTAAILRQDSDS